MGGFMEIAHNAQFSAQTNCVRRRAETTAAAVAVVDDAKGQDGLFGEDGAKILMKLLELKLPLVQRSPVGFGSFEPLDGGDDAGAELHRGVKDFGDCGRVIWFGWHGLWFLSLQSEELVGLPEIACLFFLWAQQKSQTGRLSLNNRRATGWC
jgi:hypothetical protein